MTPGYANPRTTNVLLTCKSCLTQSCLTLRSINLSLGRLVAPARQFHWCIAQSQLFIHPPTVPRPIATSSPQLLALCPCLANLTISPIQSSVMVSSQNHVLVVVLLTQLPQEPHVAAKHSQGGREKGTVFSRPITCPTTPSQSPQSFSKQHGFGRSRCPFRPPVDFQGRPRNARCTLCLPLSGFQHQRSSCSATITEEHERPRPAKINNRSQAEGPESAWRRRSTKERPGSAFQAQQEHLEAKGSTSNALYCPSFTCPVCQRACHPIRASRSLFYWTPTWRRWPNSSSGR